MVTIQNVPRGKVNILGGHATAFAELSGLFFLIFLTIFCRKFKGPYNQCSDTRLKHALNI